MAKKKKQLTASEMGRLGAAKRKENLTPEQRKENARKDGIQSGYVRRNKAKKELDAKFKKD